MTTRLMYVSYLSVSCQGERKNTLQIAIVFALLLIYAFFTWLSPRTFLSYDIF